MRSVLRRWCWVGVVLGAGCVFTSRPMIPLQDDDAGNGFVQSPSDAGRVAGGGVDASTGLNSDASAMDAAFDGAPPNALDTHCKPVAADGGDGGYLDPDGSPCDPSVRDAGRDGAVDASDGATDASDAAADGGDAR